MKSLNNIYKSAVCAIFAALIALPAAANAGYENVALRYDIVEPRKLDLSYDVYAGGFKALKAELGLDLDKKAYDMELEAETQGMIGSLFPWSATYSTSGHADDGVLVPSISTSKSQWRKKIKYTELSYDPKGNILKTTTQDGTTTVVDRDVKKELTENAVDMLTGTLLMMQNAKNSDKCAGSFPVFDGKRRFNITLHDEGMDTIAKSDFSRFSGEALKCTVKVEPVAGFKPKDKDRGWMAVQNHTEERKKPPTLWLARLEKDGPVVPVRMEIASAYGTVVAHLSNAEKK